MKNTVIYSTLAAAIAVSSAAESNLNEEVIVTGTRTEVALNEILATAHVLTQDDITRSHAQGLAQLLATLPGVDFDDNGGRGANSAIRLRGTESDHVLILIDGVRSASASNGATSLQHIPLSQIERIEVVQGPRASLYGSEAIGGVIQVFTKKGTQQTKPSIGFEVGSHNTQKTNAGISGSIGSTKYSLNAAYERTDGIDRTVSEQGADADRDGYRESSVSANIQHNFATGVSVGVNYLSSKGNLQFDSGADDNTDFTNESAHTFVKYSLTESVRLKAEFGYLKDRRDTQGSNVSLFETTRNSAGLQLDVDISENQIITLGYDFYDDKLNPSAGFVETSRDNQAYYVQYQANYAQVSVVASWREDDNEEFGSFDTGSLSMGYHLGDDTLISFSYGEAFKAPTFNDLYFPPSFFPEFGSFPGFAFVANPNLDPEQSETYELLIRSSSYGVDWSLSLYQTKIKDLIESVSSFDVVNNLIDATVGNVSKAEIEGVEVSARTRIDQWAISFSANYQEPRNELTDDILDRRPLVTANLQVVRLIGQFDIGASWQLKGHRFDGGNKLAGYGTLDLFGGYQASENFNISLRVANVFDQNYTLLKNFSEFETEGTTAYISANYNF